MPFIMNRNHSDICALNDLRQKLITRTATPEEWNIWFAGMRGAVNASDLTRIQQEMAALASGLNGEGYPVELAPQHFITGDYLSEGNITVFLGNISNIRAALKVLPATPSVPPALLNCAQANDMEQILFDVKIRLDAIKKSKRYCGEFYSGELI
ncbi:MAG: hypothetical protein RR461_05610 [Angelakisella sp.]